MMNKLNKWNLVDIQMAETSKLELAQEYADREIENLKAFAEESDPTLTTAKKGMTEQWAEAYTRWMLALRILEIIARHEKGDEELHVQAACKQSGFYSL